MPEPSIHTVRVGVLIKKDNTYLFGKRKSKHAPGTWAPHTTLMVVAKYIGGEPQNLEPEKCEGWGWFDWDNLPEPLFLAQVNAKAAGWQPNQDTKVRNLNTFNNSGLY